MRRHGAVDRRQRRGQVAVVAGVVVVVLERHHAHVPAHAGHAEAVVARGRQQSRDAGAVRVIGAVGVGRGIAVVVAAVEAGYEPPGQVGMRQQEAVVDDGDCHRRGVVPQVPGGLGLDVEVLELRVVELRLRSVQRVVRHEVGHADGIALDVGHARVGSHGRRAGRRRGGQAHGESVAVTEGVQHLGPHVAQPGVAFGRRRIRVEAHDAVDGGGRGVGGAGERGGKGQEDGNDDETAHGRHPRADCGGGECSTDGAIGGEDNAGPRAPTARGPAVCAPEAVAPARPTSLAPWASRLRRRKSHGRNLRRRPAAEPTAAG